MALHDCRHTAASHLLMAGVPVQVVSSILGIDPAVLMRTYAHFIPGMAEAALAKQAHSFLA